VPPANDNSDEKSNKAADSSLCFRVTHPKDGTGDEEEQYRYHEADQHARESLKSFGTFEDKKDHRNDKKKSKRTSGWLCRLHGTPIANVSAFQAELAATIRSSSIGVNKGEVG
jgi:hypothetical protein